MKILADASLPLVAQTFKSPFDISYYHDLKQVKSLLTDKDILLCRSTLKVDKLLLENSNIKIVATASSGIDHIDINYLNKSKIRLISAPGSNAKAVGDYVLSVLAGLELNSNFFAGKIGIIGLGHVGEEVSMRLTKLNFSVIKYDPLKASQSNFSSVNFQDLFDCDLICIHANLHDDDPFASRNLLNNKFFNNLSKPLAIINAARGGIVDEKALLAAKNKVFYCTDVFVNEPNVSPEIVKFAYLATPHIAGHSIEAKKNAVYQISLQIHEKFNLPPPKIIINEKVATTITGKNWQQIVLSIYNPLIESEQLKKAGKNITATFQALRKAHLRHNFSLYNFSENFDIF